jgi:hypothetical protein
VFEKLLHFKRKVYEGTRTHTHRFAKGQGLKLKFVLQQHGGIGSGPDFFY